MTIRKLALLLCGHLLACVEPGTGVSGAPPRPQGPPEERPPTGTRWSDEEVVDSCGRVRRARVLVDEMCGARGMGGGAGTEEGRAGALAHLAVPMFRDGVLAGDHLFTADATHVWTLDVSDPANPRRVDLTAGLGTPIALAEYGEQLLIAAGEAGLIVATASVALEVEQRVDLGAPALDVAVLDDRALIAAGDAGLVIVRLDPLEIEARVALEHYAVAVTATASTAFVAACDATVIVDLASRSVIGRASLPAPMKDVAVSGDRAYVAAGAIGAVELDISRLEAPRVVGACRANAPSFYASGVKVSADRLLVAGGEWGILDVDRSTGACPPIAPAPPSSSSSEECRLVAPWTIVVVPPPDPPISPPVAGRDPVQVLWERELVFGFGDARRIGVRAVDVHDAGRMIHDASKIGRYQQPNVVTRIAARGGRLVIAGERAGVYRVTAEGPVLEYPLAEDLIDVGFLADGRAVFLFSRQLSIEDQPSILFARPVAGRLAIDGDRLAVPSEDGVLMFDAVARTSRFVRVPERAAFVPAIAIAGERTVIASAEWESAIELESGARLMPHGAFGASEVLDVARWGSVPPRRVLIAAGAGVLEAASFDRRSIVVVHGASGVERSAPLGPQAITAAAVGSAGERVYVVAGDHGTYRSQLIVLSAELEVERTIAFSGVALDVAVDGERVYVADADAGVRVFERDATGRLEQRAIWEMR